MIFKEGNFPRCKVYSREVRQSAIVSVFIVCSL